MEFSKMQSRDAVGNYPIAQKFIIAIGASAGGMEAIHTLFDHTPTDAVSYIVIQHLSPDHKSFMAELLSKHSKLKIFVATDGMEVEPNCVYVMPEGKNMTIKEGKLLLKDRQSATPNSAVDIFFNSLAEDQGNKSIGIVMSGNGSDGTKGIAAIKKVGGMVIVQDPASTEYNSMPNHAIDSGYYDFILAPKLIPKQIVHYVLQKTLAYHFSVPVSEKEEAAFSEVMVLIKEHTPLDFSEYKRPTIIRRIVRRMMAKNVSTLSEYIELLRSDTDEIELLSKDFLISVTKFFRDPEAYQILHDTVIPDIMSNKLLVDTLKIWVIGCATGEEAFSLAILIKEYLMEAKKDIEVKIFASDIDKEALAKASKGCYPESSVKDLSEKRLTTFFTKEGNEYKVRDNIRNMIIFADHDIVHQPPYGKIDFISCRNLLIYFNATLQKKIFSTLHFCLNKGGYLLLGPSEGIGDFKKVFQEVDKKWKIYKHTGVSETMGINDFSPHLKEMKPFSYPTISLPSSKTQLPSQLSEMLFLSHLEEAGFMAGVCIDADRQIVLPFGAFENYLLPKLFNNHLLELLPSELSIAVGASVQKAMTEHKNVTVTGIRFLEKEILRKVSILVKPFFKRTDALQKIMVVYFSEDTADTGNKEEGELFDNEVFSSRYLSGLEQELAETKLRLQNADKALDVSHDNIQSYNEELLSGNEEMQSSNEELQSINEELITVNNEYQLKIKELAELNDDFNNYFRSTYNSQLYVDNHGLIKRFSPVTMRQINVRENDIGRPLADISTNIKFCTLSEDIREVINTQVIMEKQIETTDGRWYMMDVLPYVKSLDGKTDGVIITFNDITDIKASKAIISEAHDRLVKINEDHDTFIYSVSHDLKAPLSNMEGLIVALKESSDKEEIDHITNLLNLSVIKLKQNIDELADITHIGREVQIADLLDLSELLEEVKASIAGSILESKAIFATDFKEVVLKFSKKNLRSILLNLLSNAIKYRSHDRSLEIEIRTHKEVGFIVLSVEDNGLGIAQEALGKVFSKFKRVHDLESNVEGTGIGLYLIKKLITNAGGKIEVESELGRGSCSKVYFKN